VLSFLTTRIKQGMKGENALIDLAAKVSRDLAELHRIFTEADLVFREFRLRLLESPPPAHLMPLEWIPLSNH
jgi:hypothetical protein